MSKYGFDKMELRPGAERVFFVEFLNETKRIVAAARSWFAKTELATTASWKRTGGGYYVTITLVRPGAVRRGRKSKHGFETLPMNVLRRVEGSYPDIARSARQWADRHHLVVYTERRANPDGAVVIFSNPSLLLMQGKVTTKAGAPYAFDELERGHALRFMTDRSGDHRRIKNAARQFAARRPKTRYAAEERFIYRTWTDEHGFLMILRL